MEYGSVLLMKEFVTHDVLRFVLARPEGLTFEPGQGVNLAIDEDGWRDLRRPFTPTSTDADGVVEFIIKIYPEHEGMTRRLARLEPGAGLLISGERGHIRYKGPGVFIAGGSGITPFLAILRDLRANGSLDGQGLIFANKRPRDVICEKELRDGFGERAVFVVEEEAGPGYQAGRVDSDLLRRHVGDFDQNFYVCGPKPFNRAVGDALREFGADPEALVF
ncbi:MAG: FAD-binding oxidoreductase [Acidihalobacter sp.]|jgi:ferredoxin-NADP reductase